MARQVQALAEFLRRETTGGRLLLLATAVALGWANTPGGNYWAFWSAHPLPVLGVLHLHLSLAAWVTGGLLSVFFLLAGLEVKRGADRR